MGQVSSATFSIAVEINASPTPIDQAKAERALFVATATGAYDHSFQNRFRAAIRWRAEVGLAHEIRLTERRNLEWDWYLATIAA